MRDMHIFDLTFVLSRALVMVLLISTAHQVEISIMGLFSPELVACSQFRDVAIANLSTTIHGKTLYLVTKYAMQKLHCHNHNAVTLLVLPYHKHIFCFYLVGIRTNSCAS